MQPDVLTILLDLQAEGHWEKALGLNPLFPQGWFAMGYCCMKTHHTQRALEVSLTCLATTTAAQDM